MKQYKYTIFKQDIIIAADEEEAEKFVRSMAHNFKLEKFEVQIEDGEQNE